MSKLLKLLLNLVSIPIVLVLLPFIAFGAIVFSIAGWCVYIIIRLIVKGDI